MSKNLIQRLERQLTAADDKAALHRKRCIRCRRSIKCGTLAQLYKKANAINDRICGIEDQMDRKNR